MATHKNPRRKKRAGYTLNASLNEIYKQRPRSQEVRLTQAKKQKRGALFFGIVVMLGAFTALTWVGFYLFGNNAQFNDKHIAISIDTPRNITSGDELTLTIHYKNQQDTTLNNAELRIKPPEGFVLTSTEPKANGSNEYHFKMGKLQENEGGKIILKGMFIGTRDGSNELTAYFTYQPENFNAQFEKVESAKLEIQSVPLSLSVKAPQIIAAGTQTNIDLTLKNEAENELGPIALAWYLPEQLDITSTKPETPEGQFIIPVLKPQEEWKGNVSGIFKHSAQGEHQLKFTASIIIDEKEYLQNEIKHIIDVTGAELETTLSVNDFQKKGSVAPGESINIQAQIRNRGENAQEAIIISLDIEEPTRDKKGMINWDAATEKLNADINVEQIGEQRQRTTLTWNEKNTEALQRIEPQSSHTQPVSLPVLTPETFGGALPGNTIIISMRAQTDGGTPTHTAPFEVMLRSNTNVSTYIQPAGDPIIGVGPDGLTEVSVRPYDVQLLITNSLHEIQAIEVEAVIPDGVVFEKIIEIPAGEMQFVGAKRTIRWILNKMPTNVTEIPLSFRLDTITPIGDQESQVLISHIELTAIDAVSQEPFKIKIGEVERK